MFLGILDCFLPSLAAIIGLLHDFVNVLKFASMECMPFIIDGKYE